MAGVIRGNLHQGGLSGFYAQPPVKIASLCCGTDNVGYLSLTDRVQQQMAKSLQEQLLAAGLADAQKVRQIREEKRKAQKQQKHQKPTDAAPTPQQQAQAAREAQAARDREINRQRQAEADRRAIQAQVQQLIAQHQLARNAADTPYQFVFNGKVKKIDVSAAQADQLARGRLAIAASGQTFQLIPADIADKIRQRDAQAPLVQHVPQTASDEDPYADYQIPDDLMW